MEGERAVITCEVDYQGRWAPHMDWTNTDQVDELHNDTIDGTAKWVFEIDPLTPDDNGKSFTCKTSYNVPPASGEDVATNAPTIENVQDCTTTVEVLCE